MGEGGLDGSAHDAGGAARGSAALADDADAAVPRPSSARHGGVDGAGGGLRGAGGTDEGRGAVGGACDPTEDGVDGAGGGLSGAGGTAEG